MLKKKALRKIFITTLTMFIILTIYTIPKEDNKKVLRTNLEIEDITNINTDTVYLLNKEGYLVKTNVFIESNNINEKIEKIISYLTIDNEKIPVSLNGYIPKKTKLINYNFDENYLVLNFSKEFLTTDNERLMIMGLVNSLLEIKEIKKVSILIDNKNIPKYTNMDKNIGINCEYLYNNRKDIEKVTVYYIDKTNNYYVPITKYINTNKNKIDVIIDELKNTNNDLISFINNNAKLIDSHEESNVLFLNFNKYLKDDNKQVEEKILNTIAYSIFDNIDVNMVMFEINGKKLKYIERK